MSDIFGLQIGLQINVFIQGQSFPDPSQGKGRLLVRGSKKNLWYRRRFWSYLILGACLPNSAVIVGLSNLSVWTENMFRQRSVDGT